MQTSSTVNGGGQTTFTISSDLPASDTLVITTGLFSGPDGGHGSSISTVIASGDVPPCQVVDAPAGSTPGPPPAG